MSNFSRETIQITTKDKAVSLHVWFYKPNISPPFPVVIAGHGLTLIKDAGLAAFGEVWATKAGYASLIFDYRYFGDSDGQPRNLVSIQEQLEDYKTVISWARRKPEQFLGDKIIVMGFSLSGLSVATLAVEDPGLSGVIANCPVLNGYKTFKSMKFNPGVVFWAIIDVIKAKIGLSPVFIKAIGHPNELAFLRTPSSYSGFVTMFSHGSASFEESPNLIAPRVAFEIMGARRSLKDACCPVLLVIGKDDDLIPAQIAHEIAERATATVTLVDAPGGHFDLFAGGHGFEANITAQLAFLESLR